MLRYILIILGTFSLTLGLIGIVTPGLPTTPFLLLTAFLYGKASPKLYKKVLNHKVTGSYIKRVDRGLSWKAKLFSISFMWVMISFSVFVVFSENKKMQIILLGLGAIGTIAQLIVFGRKKLSEKKAKEVCEKE